MRADREKEGGEGREEEETENTPGERNRDIEKVT